MQIVPLTKEKHQEWDEFCLESDDAWFKHTNPAIEYILNYKSGLKPESKSFIVIKDNKIIAICPLIIETNKDNKEFSFGMDHSMAPAFSNELTKKERDKAMKLVFKNIDKLAQEHNVKRARFRISVLSKAFTETNTKRLNFLMKFGYLDTSLNTQMIDLRKSIENLRRNVRHGHDSDIDRASKVLEAEILDNSNITREIFNQYIELHYKAAGRVTRPQITFDLLYNRIKERNAFLIGAKKDNKFVGFSYFTVFKDNVYYGSSCNDPNTNNIPIGHFIQWTAVKWMKEKKYKFYEIGWQNYSATLSNFPSEKEIHLGRFKRGFGGYTVPLFMAEKYYNKDYFLEVYQTRIRKYNDYLKERSENKNDK